MDSKESWILQKKHLDNSHYYASKAVMEATEPDYENSFLIFVQKFAICLKFHPGCDKNSHR